MTVKDDNNTNITKSVIHAMDVIVALSQGAFTINEIARNTGLNQSTIHRLLGTLMERGFVARNEITRQYSIGYFINHLAFTNMNIHRCLIISVYEEMKNLWEFSKETVSLHIQTGMQTILLEQMLSDYNLSFSEKNNTSSIKYAGAIGKVLVSQLSYDELEHLISRVNLLSITKSTVVDKELYRKQIEEVKKEGYAISFGEVVEGTAAISAPVHNYICPVAISVVGPEGRFTRNIMELVEKVKKASLNASEIISHDSLKYIR